MAEQLSHQVLFRAALPVHFFYRKTVPGFYLIQLAFLKLSTKFMKTALPQSISKEDVYSEARLSPGLVLTKKIWWRAHCSVQSLYRQKQTSAWTIWPSLPRTRLSPERNRQSTTRPRRLQSFNIRRPTTRPKKATCGSLVMPLQTDNSSPSISDPRTGRCANKCWSSEPVQPSVRTTSSTI